jgi:hypothetical protein
MAGQGLKPLASDGFCPSLGKRTADQIAVMGLRLDPDVV